MAVMDALQRYRPDMGAAFSTYAVTAIRHRVRRYIDKWWQHFGRRHGPLNKAALRQKIYEADVVEQAVCAEVIRAVLRTLMWREREVLVLRYGLNDGYIYTLKEVGRIFRITREQVRQIEAKAINKLRRPVRASRLRPFIEPKDSATIPQKQTKPIVSLFARTPPH